LNDRRIQFTRGDCAVRSGARSRRPPMPPIARLTGALWLAAMASSCAATHSALRPPYEFDGVEYDDAGLQALAAGRCNRADGARAARPPRPFTTDGCTWSPAGSWTECCVEHDMAYWCGGSARMREAADQALRSCVTDHGYPLLAIVMYAGVRIGGVGWIPTPWRWGYGYPWPRGAPAPAEVAPPPNGPEDVPAVQPPGSGGGQAR